MYVTDVIGETYKNWRIGVVLINAGTGTGKTTFVVKTLNEWAEITGTKILYLCNRRALKSQVIEQAEAEQKAKTLDDDAPDDSAGEEHLDIWTYQALEKMKLYHPEELDVFLRQYRYIVA
ncbi:DEAD/DEAH box helicase family protein, partial [uncultured Gemmiger sp.]|uniref:DEAD/DEAH box helicase family protein n=1 Tax=uncultured Gemmiger sp. TaxID=1623490 RepID=UPI0025EAC732